MIVVNIQFPLASVIYNLYFWSTVKQPLSMPQTIHSFAQSDRLIDPINQQRIKQEKRILWPDYQVLTLINLFEQASAKQQNQIDLSNLFTYCAIEEKFTVKKANEKEYLHLSDCYDHEFTHMAVYLCRSGTHQSRCQASRKIQINSSLHSRRKSLMERSYISQNNEVQHQELYVILSKRAIAIDEVIKTNHKVCISVIPLSKDKHLWGGQLNFQQFQPLTLSKTQQEQVGLFKSGGQTFGFNITSNKPINVQGSFRKSHGVVDRRQSQFSNYQSAKRNPQKQEEKKEQNQIKQPKECTNTLRISPQHIRQHKQFLYIQIDLTNNCQLPQNPNEYNFTSIDIFARLMKPKYGAKYDDQSSSESQSQDSNPRQKLRTQMKEQIFIVYSMPFMAFNSYLDSQLNCEENQDLREISFRGSCGMFSAMKRLGLMSAKKQQQQRENQRNHNRENDQDKSFSIGKKQRVAVERKYQQSASPVTIFRALNSEVLANRFEEQEQKEQRQQQGALSFAIIELGPQENIKLQHRPQMTINEVRTRIIQHSVLKTKQLLGQQRSTQSLSPGIYFPVYTTGTAEPNRLSIPLQLLKLINPQIPKSTTKVQVQSERIKDKESSQEQDVEIDGKNRRKSRQSICIGSSSQNQPQNYNTKYVDIDVFLTSVVYSKPSVEKLILLLETFRALTRLSDQTLEAQTQWTRELDDLLGFASVSQVKNLLNLINDIRGQTYAQNDRSLCDIADFLKLFVWIEQMSTIDKLTSSQISLISHVKQQTQDLIEKSSNTTKNQPQQPISQAILQKQRQLSNRQQTIISLIRDYHQKHTISSQIDNFPIEIFFQFLNQQLKPQNNALFFVSLDKIFSRSQELIDMIKSIENVFGKFFLMNSGQIFGASRKSLSELMIRFDELCLKQLGKEREVEIDGHEEYTATVTVTNHDDIYSCLSKHSTPLPLIKLLRFSLKYAMQHMTSIPIKIFLSRPLQSFYDLDQVQQQQQQVLENHSNPRFKSQLQSLKKFIKKYFIRGHDHFDSHHTAISQLDNDSRFMDLVTDLLQMYIKVGNHEKAMVGANGDRKEKKVSDVIELINEEYSGWLKRGGDFVLSRVICSGRSADEVEEICSFGKVNGNDLDSKIQAKYQSKINKLKSSPSYTFNITQFLIINHHHQTHQSIFTKPSSRNSSVPLTNLFKKPTPKSITLHNTNQPIALSSNKLFQQTSQKYDFSVKVSQRNSLKHKNNLQTQKSLRIQIFFAPAKVKQTSSKADIYNDNYQISLLNGLLDLSNGIGNKCIRKNLFSCYQALVKAQIIIKNDLKSDKSPQQDFQAINVFGSSVIIFDNFKTSNISTTSITLLPSNKQQQLQLNRIPLSNIHKIRIQIHSHPLSVLQHSLSFVNLRLNKYLRSILPQNLSANKKPPRKTIGGRFTQHISKRKSGLDIEGNIGKNKYRNARTTEHINSTLYDLPEPLVYHLLNTDKCYVGQEQKLLTFIDNYYEKNQPNYQDYVLYLTIRPNYLRLSTVLRHFFTNRSKYQQSPILNSFIKLKTSSPFADTGPCKISRAFSFMPRISSMRPLKNVRDTLEERELLVKYTKESLKRQSLQKNYHKELFNQNSQNSNSMFAKKQTKLEVNKQKRQEQKDVEI